MTAKSSAERVAALRERRAELGLARLEVWAHPDDHEAIKTKAAQLQRRREKGLAGTMTIYGAIRSGAFKLGAPKNPVQLAAETEEAGRRRRG